MAAITSFSSLTSVYIEDESAYGETLQNLSMVAHIQTSLPLKNKKEADRIANSLYRSNLGNIKRLDQLVEAVIVAKGGYP